MLLKSLVVLGAMAAVSQISWGLEKVSSKYPPEYACQFYYEHGDNLVNLQTFRTIVLGPRETWTSKNFSYGAGVFKARVNTVNDPGGTGIGVDISFTSKSIPSVNIKSASSQPFGSSTVNTQLIINDVTAVLFCELIQD